MFEKDYIMRQISMAVQVAARLIFGKNEPVYHEEDSQNSVGGDLLHAEILRLLQAGKINEAEDALFDQLDAGIPDLPAIATDFYYRLSLFDDDALEASGFSRAEIDQGLIDFMARSGISLPIPDEDQSLFRRITLRRPPLFVSPHFTQKAHPEGPTNSGSKVR